MAPHRVYEDLPDVIDIRRNEIDFDLVDDINKGLQAPKGEKCLPSMIFYDEKGLRLFEAITYLDEYYPTNTEIAVLEEHADEIAENIRHGAQVVELGSGNLRKVKILLAALERAQKDIDYYALDLSLSELHRTLAEVPIGEYQHVRCHGLHGTYDDGFEWLQAPENARRPKCVVSLGSSIGNFGRADAASFLKNISDSLNANDIVLIATDGCEDPSRVHHAYNDRHGITHSFYRNGLRQVNRLLGQELFVQDEFDIIGEFNAEACRHQAFVSPRRDIELGGFTLARGEKIHIENAHKYPSRLLTQLWADASFTPKISLADSRGDYHVDMLLPRPKPFSLNPLEYAKEPVPRLDEFQQLWATWDLVSRDMIPREELLSQPINLRNCCLFYLGHIPGFLDKHVTRVLGGKPTEPASFQDVFERGVDPDVENPELCHAHSEAPPSWPPVDEILGYQSRVRARVTSLYETGRVASDHKIAYALWLGLEHEAMHLETFLYMLLQSDKTLAPPGPQPDFEALAHKAETELTSNHWVKVPQQGVEIGMKRPTEASKHDYYGWDNEYPARNATVPAFETQTRPLTNGDYVKYLTEAGVDELPASWSVRSSATNGCHNGDANLSHAKTVDFDHFLKDKAVRTVYGPVPLALALDWPVVASYNELAGCAKWMNGRIPTFEEILSIYNYAEKLKGKDISFMSPHNIPAVNAHLSNDGVQESPPQRDGSKLAGTKNGATADSNALFADLTGCNVGFQAFHPVPVTQQADDLAGRAGMGGVWEWSSSVLDKWDGFKPMKAYPEYTADFFDGKHNIMLGGSWATHPRIAGRRSFINYFQRNYPYAWAGARLVRDIADVQ